MKKIVEMWNRVSLIAKILVGIVIGAVLGLLVPGATVIGLIGTMFVRALKAIAPILVFALVISSIANAGKGNGQQFRMVTIMYMLSTLCAAVVAVSASFIFPVTMTLDLESYQADVVPSGIMEVLQNLLLNITDNPVNAILNANYLCILAWALLFGLAMRRTSKSIKSALVSISDAVSTVVRWIIGCAPFGIMGLVFTTVSESGLSIFKEYGRLLLVLVGAMLTVALIVDPLLATIVLRRNAYPLAWRCLRESGVTAFFTRSSAANIPVNMSLCKRLGLDPDVYSVSIPLGATINMDGTSIMQGVAVVFAAQAFGIHLSMTDYITVIGTATLASIGTAGVPSVGLVTLTMVFNSVGLPVEAIGLIMGIDRILDMTRTAVNITGDAVCTTIVAHQNKALDKNVFYAEEN